MTSMWMTSMWLRFEGGRGVLTRSLGTSRPIPAYDVCDARASGVSFVRLSRFSAFASRVASPGSVRVASSVCAFCSGFSQSVAGAGTDGFQLHD